MYEVKVVKIKKLFGNGLSQKKIADMFGVSRGTVQNIKKRVTWKDI